VRPYCDFSCQTPYFSATSWSGSASSGNWRPYFFANLALLASSRMLTPSTAALWGLNPRARLLERAGLPGAARRVVLRIEIEDQRPPCVVRQAVRLPGLVLQGEGGRFLPR